ncbi:phenylalanine--tRNA ligase subunit beta [Virgibacillus sp. MSP4-1]|uniref:phenylalanine--tRNA ligase subunit beta n=1 Tax=Virgibacillus sp. MSP4-1 TaxID=2700081 RepID=UPI0003A10E53|nr:phenylalanine--tRNA ligase subunit beta [Virgibacillus sp. MSP4-1]QHS22963.1 phenylalanine--tRNA ligase subunit beta [Virgibacillus sp. MSP4-1]
MLLSLNWLKHYVDLDDISPDDLAEKITKGGIEVDGVEKLGEGLKNIVVGYVKSCEQHPNADKLNVCQVDVGEEELQIICGAPNVAAGQKVVVAKPGARLPGGMKIKKTKLRGEVSNGMICSLQELGVEQKFVQKEFEDGIFVLPKDTEVGSNAVDLLNLNDTILDLDITPNRADSFSMIGMAYEVAAILDKDLHLPEVKAERIDESATDYVQVKVKDPDLNPYYGAYVVKNIQIGPSPLWMRNRLIAAGIRPINNVVDITNYVLMEYGQPLHAFDLDRFNSNEVVVRRARKGETMTTLDGEKRDLQEDHLLITNGEEGMALAGVMGGADSEVKDDTTTVLVEAAYFNPLTVRKSSKDHGLRSESSIRFERGVDPARVKEAGLRACQLMQQYAGGEVLSGIAEFDEQKMEPSIVEFDAETINKRLGTDISVDEMKHILHRLRFSFEEKDAHFIVYAPSRRGDIQIVEDMLEEIARIYGYDNLPYTLPEGASNAGGLTKKQKLKRSIHRYMQSAGLNEAMTYSLTREENTAKFMDQTIRAQKPKAVKLAMPMSEAHSHLRLSILPELLASLQYNLARRQQDVALYELGAIYVNTEDNLSKQPNEQLRLSAAITGTWVNQQWQKEIKEVDFFVLKGVAEGLLDTLQIQTATFEPLKMEEMHPGRTAAIRVDDEHVGFIGQIHPAVQKEMDLSDTYVFDLDADRLLEIAMEKEETYEPIPRYPSVTQDLAFVVDEDTLARHMMDVIEQAGQPHLKDIQVFDIYQGEHMVEGKKSIAFNVRFQDPEATLKDEQVEKARKQIVDAVENSFQAELRG